MIRKGKLVKNTAIALAIISVFGNTLSTVSAAEIMKSSTAIEQYVEGTYDISAKLIKDNSDEDSMANGYLKETKIEISKNKMYMVMTFENGKLLKELKKIYINICANHTIIGIDICGDSAVNNDLFSENNIINNKSNKKILDIIAEEESIYESNNI